MQEGPKIIDLATYSKGKKMVDAAIHLLESYQAAVGHSLLALRDDLADVLIGYCESGGGLQQALNISDQELEKIRAGGDIPDRLVLDLLARLKKIRENYRETFMSIPPSSPDAHS